MARTGGSGSMIAIFTVVGMLGAAAAAFRSSCPLAIAARRCSKGTGSRAESSTVSTASGSTTTRFQASGPFELHLGPYHEFALFRGVQEAHRDHTSEDNLLRPFNIEVIANRARQRWETAGLSLDVALGGGGRDDCESWFVTLKRTVQPSSD